MEVAVYMRKIGKHLVKEVMNPVFEHVKESDPLSKVITQLEKEEIDTIPVLDKDGEYIGDIHERDLLKLVILPEDVPTEEITGVFGAGVDLQYFATKAKDMVKRHDITISPDSTVSKAAVIMLHHDVNSLPVVEEGKLVGILTELHILEEIFEHHQAAKRGKR